MDEERVLGLGIASCDTELRRIVEETGAAIDEALGSFLGSDDIRGPHKARVALRRLTTCLDAFAPLMRQKPLARLRREAKAMFRALGTVRDSDVYTADRIGQPGQTSRQRKNQRLREATRAKLRKHKAVTFAPRLVSAMAPDSPLFRQKVKAQDLRAAPIQRFAAGLLQKAWDDCLSFGVSVEKVHARKRHDFRKSLKAMRYLSEFFGEVFPGLSQDPFLSDFRDLQDALGLLNDFDVALAIEGRKRPKVLPEREAQALATAEALWARLAAAAPPWRA